MQLWGFMRNGVCSARFKGTARSNPQKSDISYKIIFSAAESAEKFVANGNRTTGMARVFDSIHWIFRARKYFPATTDRLSADSRHRRPATHEHSICGTARFRGP